MGEVVSELGENARAATSEQLRASLPELFDPDPCIERARACVEEVHARVSVAVRALDRIAISLGRGDELADGLRSRLEDELAALDAVLIPDALDLRGRELAPDAEMSPRQGGSVASHTVTVISSVVNVEEIVHRISSPAERIERFLSFVAEMEAELAELRRLEDKICELQAHLAAQENEQARLEAVPPDAHDLPVDSARLHRVRETRRQTEQRLEQRLKQEERLRARLAEALDAGELNLEASGGPAPLGAIADRLREALQVSRSAQCVVRDREAELRSLRHARMAQVARWGIGAALTGVVVFAVLSAAWMRRDSGDGPVVGAELTPIKRSILEHAFLKPRLTAAERGAVQRAKTIREVRTAFDPIFDRLEKSGEPSADRFTGLGWEMAIDLVEVGHDNVRVYFRSRAVIAVLRERFGPEATITARLVTEGSEPRFDLPMTLLRQDLCSAGRRLRFSIRIGLPFGTDITTHIDLPLDRLAASSGHCGSS